MRKFIIKTSLLFLPLLILLISLECLLQKIPNDYSYKKKYLDNHSKEIQTIIFGGSNVFFGINPDYISENTFNASHVSQSLDFDLAILYKYKNQLDNLDVIVLAISYCSLFTKLSDGIEAWRVKNYTLYYGIKDNFFSYTPELLSNRMKRNLVRLYDYYFKNKNNITCTKLGWGTTYNSNRARNLQETGKTASKRHTIDDMFSKKILNFFDDNLKTINLHY